MIPTPLVFRHRYEQPLSALRLGLLIGARLIEQHAFCEGDWTKFFCEKAWSCRGRALPISSEHRESVNFCFGVHEVTAKRSKWELDHSSPDLEIGRHSGLLHKTNQTWWTDCRTLCQFGLSKLHLRARSSFLGQG